MMVRTKAVWTPTLDGTLDTVINCYHYSVTMMTFHSSMLKLLGFQREHSFIYLMTR